MKPLIHNSRGFVTFVCFLTIQFVECEGWARDRVGPHPAAIIVPIVAVFFIILCSCCIIYKRCCKPVDIKTTVTTIHSPPNMQQRTVQTTYVQQPPYPQQPFNQPQHTYGSPPMIAPSVMYQAQPPYPTQQHPQHLPNTTNYNDPEYQRQPATAPPPYDG